VGAPALVLAVGTALAASRTAPTPELGVSTTLVSGTVAPGAAIGTLYGPLAFGGVASPRLRLGVSGALVQPLGDRGRLSARWGVFRDQALCDTCADGAPPGWLGDELVGTTDLQLDASTDLPMDGGAALRVALGLTAPASRDGFLCNPLLGAPSAAAAFLLPTGEGQLVVGARLTRPVYGFRAVPVGRCAPALSDATVDTLAGTASATPWVQSWWGVQNPVLLLTTTATWLDPHALIGGVDDRLTTALQVGLVAERDAQDPAVRVDTLAGSFTMPASREPARVSVPWAARVGFEVTPATEVALSLSNALPAVLADPGGTLRALPSRTAVTLGLTGRPRRSEPR
jgi:hypothetical protein